MNTEQDLLLIELQAEINKLVDKKYRDLEKIWATDKQIVYIKKLFAKVKTKDKMAINDFCRNVMDIASLNSRLFMLTNRLNGE